MGGDGILELTEPHRTQDGAFGYEVLGLSNSRLMSYSHY